MLILLLYGAGLRISEALSLRLSNVDLTAGAVGRYVAQRAKEHPTQLDGALFPTRTGTPVARHTAENIFRRLRVRAGVLRQDGGRYQPRLHDLRHAFAVHRLVSPGIARGQTCNAFCRNWQLTSALFISLRHSVTLP